MVLVMKIMVLVTRTIWRLWLELWCLWLKLWYLWQALVLAMKTKVLVIKTMVLLKKIMVLVTRTIWCLWQELWRLWLALVLAMKTTVLVMKTMVLVTRTMMLVTRTMVKAMDIGLKFGTSPSQRSEWGERWNGSFWTTTHPWVDWAQQPWLAASLVEGQLWFKTYECQVSWTSLTCDHGSGPSLWTYNYGKENAPTLHESPSYGWNSWCQHGITRRVSS